MNPGGESPVDLEKAIALFDNDMAFFRQMCGTFLDYLPQQIEKLSAAALNGNPELVELCAHGIKGAAANLHAVGVSSVARSIEDRGREKQIAGVAPLIADLRREIERLEHFLRTMQ
jgi:HPt (histidine-containing phosphotransfer) domain-containing protein